MAGMPTPPNQHAMAKAAPRGGPDMRERVEAAAAVERAAKDAAAAAGQRWRPPTRDAPSSRSANGSARGGRQRRADGEARARGGRGGGGGGGDGGGAAGGCGRGCGRHDADRGDGPIVRIGANGSGFTTKLIQEPTPTPTPTPTPSKLRSKRLTPHDTHRPISGDGLSPKGPAPRGAAAESSRSRQDAGGLAAAGDAAIAAVAPAVGTVVVSDPKSFPKSAPWSASLAAPRGAAVAAVAGWVVHGRLGLAVAGEHRCSSGARLVRRQPQAWLWVVDAAAVRV